MRNSVLLLCSILFGSLIGTASACESIAIGSKTKELAFFFNGEKLAFPIAYDIIQLIDGYYPFIDAREIDRMKQGNHRSQIYTSVVDVDDICNRPEGKKITPMEMPTRGKAASCFTIAALGDWGWHLQRFIRDQARGMSGAAVSKQGISNFIHQKLVPVLVDASTDSEGNMRFDARQVEAVSDFLPALTLAWAHREMTGSPPTTVELWSMCMSSSKKALYEKTGYADLFEQLPN